MERYYDIDKLAEMLQAKADTLIEGKEAFLYVAKWLELLPAADVVPKSESLPLDVHEALKQRAVEKAKADVAREIFAEIEEFIHQKTTAISMFKDGEDDFYDGEIHALEVFEHYLAKLKKKYTEGESNGSKQ